MPRPQAEGEDASTVRATDIEGLFREYHPRVYAYVRYRVSDVIEAEDLTSDIFERALIGLSSYDARKGAFSTWLFAIAHNTWANHVKKQHRRRPHHVDLGEDMVNLPSDGPTPEQGVVRGEEVARLLSCLGTLPARQQEILSMRFAGQLTNREIAQVLHMNERTVSVYSLRALRKLRDQLLRDSEIQ